MSEEKAAPDWWRNRFRTTWAKVTWDEVPDPKMPEEPGQWVFIGHEVLRAREADGADVLCWYWERLE